jgi:hypothetical protein
MHANTNVAPPGPGARRLPSVLPATCLSTTSDRVDDCALHAHHGRPAKYVDARSCGSAPQANYSPEEEVAAF